MSQQATLGAFDARELEDAHEPREVDARHWDPLAGHDPTRCLDCDEKVSMGIRRLFGIGEDDHVSGCPECKPMRWLDSGGTVPGRDVKPGPEERYR